jgi:methoxymalonate biosynthesis protein
VIKCVIWDLDNTLLDGVYLEMADEPPPANPVLAGVLAELAGRGILQAIASRNPPEAAQYARQITGHQFAAVRCEWGAKSASVTSILAELDLAADSVAFVDDDALERAEVAYTLPDVLVIEPGDLPDAVSWPQFSPGVITDEARRRGELYLQRRARQEEARAFGGSRQEFLRYCGTAVTIGPAGRPDLPRLHELSVRTHQFNSAGTEVDEAALAGLLGAPTSLVITVRLADRFSDDGLVGGCVVLTGAGTWEVSLLMMSCRATGRGVIDALLAWLCQIAHDAGAAALAVPCVINPRNVPLRIALTGAGFRVRDDDDAVPLPAAESRTAVYARSLDGALPPLPSSVRADELGQGR